VDPVLFENFLTEDGDLLRAKFQAFKFPETNFVLFKGIVNVCLDRCNGVQCSNGQVGYGRKRRSVENDSDDQKVSYEVSMSTVVKVGEEANEILPDLTKLVQKERQTKETFNAEEAIISEFHPDELAIARLSEAFGPFSSKYIDFQLDNSSTKTISKWTFWITLPVLILWTML